MKILQIHNRYKDFGGEDVVVEVEYSLLKSGGVEIKQLLFDNDRISPHKIFYNRESNKLVLDAIDQFNPDIIHVHNLFYEASPSILYAAKAKCIPVVMTVHNFRLLCPGALFLRDSKICIKCKDLIFPYYGVIHKCFKDSYSKSVILSSFIAYSKLNRTWNKFIDKLIVLTPFIKDLMVESSLGIDSDKIIVKPNSTDDMRCEIIGNENREGFLFIGRLSIEKGVKALVHAFNKMPHIKLGIIGTGEQEEDLKKIALDNIVFYGKQDKKFIKKKLSSVKALVFPSICYEGLPNTIIEAFSSGTPVITSNIDNINTIVSAGFNGEVFITGNIESLIQKVMQVNKMDIRDYQINARSTYEKLYAHQVNFSNLMNIYTELKGNEEKDY